VINSSTSSNDHHGQDERGVSTFQAWARPDAFPKKPTKVKNHQAKPTSSTLGAEAEFGFFDRKGHRHDASDVKNLAEKISYSKDGVELVWTPESDYLVVPEAIPALHKSLRFRQKRGAEYDISDGIKMCGLFGAFLLYTIYAAWRNSGGHIEVLYTQPVIGVAALMLLIFGLIPLYEGWKTRRHLSQMTHRDMDEDLPDAQFDTWMYRQPIPWTYALVALLLVCGAVQFWVDRSGVGLGGMKWSILRVGLLKRAGVPYLSQFPDATAMWRIFTAPFVHGNIVHLLMNAAGLLYLGRRTETLLRWPHLFIVFFISMWVGGFTSFYGYPERPAVGASGGIMGLLGCLFVFESLHRQLVPRLARKRLAAGIILMAVMGGVGVSFVDNAAHIGGLLAGMLYAFIVFPSSSSLHRPTTLTKDKVVGSVAGIALLLASLTTVLKMLA